MEEQEAETDPMEEQVGGGDWDEAEMPVNESVRVTADPIVAVTAPIVGIVALSVPSVLPMPVMPVKSWRDMPSVPRAADGSEKRNMIKV